MEVKYKAGYAKSGRSSCHKCKGVIAVHRLRLGKNTPSKFFDGYQLVWYHPACLVNKDRANIKSSDNIEAFEHIKFEDQQYVRKLLGESPGVRDEQSIANNKIFWEVKNILNTLPLSSLKELLEFNGCPTTGGNARLVFKCAEGIVYGVTTCSVCGKTGLLNFAKGQYTCEAVNDWGKCGNVMASPKSTVDWKFPSTLQLPSALRSYKRIPRSAGSLGDEGEDEGEEEGEGEGDEEGEGEEEDRSDGELDGGFGRVDDEGEDHEDRDEDEGDEDEGEDRGNDAREELSPQKLHGFTFGTTLSVFGSATGGSGQPLYGMTFSQAGRLSVPKRQLIQTIRSNGGTYSSSISNKVDFVVTTAAELERGRRRIRRAKELQCTIVLELFVHRLIANKGPFDQSPYVLLQSDKAPGTGKTPKSPTTKKRAPKKVAAIKVKPVAKKAAPKAMKISMKKPSGKDFKVRQPKIPKIAKAKATLPTKAAPKALAKAPPLMQLPSFQQSAQASPSSGGVVDPESKCSSPPSKILVDGSDVYNMMLNQTDIMAGVNKYFKLQLIDATGNGSKFVFFAKWGRVGTDIGMSMNRTFTNKQEAIGFFADKFKDKSGNEWSERRSFVKKPGKYLPIEMDDAPAGEPLSSPAIQNALPPKTEAGKPKVDSYSKHAADAHVLVEDGVIYDTMLNQTNIASNNNKFYVIQVLESNDNKTYWAWNRWGRVGEAGQNSIVATSKVNAIAMFKKKFTEKTKNVWEQREDFKAVAGKYTLLQMDYGADESPVPTPGSTFGNVSSVQSNLDSAVHDLVNLIFDVKMMERTLADLNIDVKKMPLGKLSKTQILKGYDTLTQIDAKLKQSAARADLAMLSSQFYTIVPHDFGRKVPEIIDNVNLLKAKMKQMDTLIEIQVASELIQQAAASGIHPTDAKYNKLGTKIEVLPSYTQDFQMISKYLSNTYEESESPYTLELENVFVIERQGEDKRFESFSGLENRQLLWHGSRLSNWVGIISQGLRIAPPEAPKTGYMFGKGVYFGDMVAKSAEYCFTTPGSNTGLLLLSKVALGASYELTQPQYMEKAPTNYHSCHALAKTMPDPSDTGTMSDLVTKVPYGRGVPSNVSGAFLSHGEFVVYDVAQISMKYLLRVKFHHKPGFVAAPL